MVKAAGRVGLVGERPLDLNVDGTLNVAAVSVLLNKLRAEGDTALSLHARGTVSCSGARRNGHTDGSDGGDRDEPNIAAENMNARLELAGRRIS